VHRKKRRKKISKRYGWLIVLALFVVAIAVIGFGEYRNSKIEKANAAEAQNYNAKMEAANKKAEKLDALNHKYKDKKWLALGDSITANNKYQSIVASLCEMASYQTDAIPGQAIGTMADRLTKDELSDIGLVTVFGGTNNYGGNKPLGKMGDDKTVDTFYGNLEKVIYKISSLNPKVKIVFFTPTKRGEIQNQPVYPNPNAVGVTLDQYVQAIKDVCKEHSIQVIDLFNKSGIDTNNLSQYTVDNLHPNQAGYELISKVIADELNK
jgi:lysophospholipase L1-like esterase